MSGYRTLHRYTQQQPTAAPPSEEDADTQDGIIDMAEEAIFSAQFSPCGQTHSTLRSESTGAAVPASPVRLLAASSTGCIYGYKITDKNAAQKMDMLDAEALSMECTDILMDELALEGDGDGDGNGDGNTCSDGGLVNLGCAAVSSIRNYVGEDVRAGGEITAAIRLDGLVSIWKRAEQSLYPDDEGSSTSTNTSTSNGSAPRKVKAHAQFSISNATGTTMMLLPPQSTGYSKHGIILMVGNLDGSISFHCTGIGIPDSRKCNDDTIFTDMGTVLNTVGSGNSIPMSMALHPSHHLTFAVGRKNGSIDIYSSASSSQGGQGSNSGQHSIEDDVYGQLRRCHRLAQHAGAPVRALCYTPDGSLLLSGCDEGHIYIHDTSSFHKNESIRMVAAILNAHRGYILSICALPDEKRFVTSSADKTVKVWNVGMPNAGPVHTFDTGHDNMVWDVAGAVDGRKCASCGDDGLIQIYSCEE
uniref:Anaphase-promoting complex subunit 4 WD40 domain-containing protein n=1 Tax=Chaetoceros debilis TaxID=122233 RepID=A0A7S3QB72_9STRA